MARLRDRNRQIPGGLRYIQAETGWNSTKHLAPGPSLRALATAILNHRRGNPHLAMLHGWKMTLEEIEIEVEVYNAKICIDHGWHDYVAVVQGEPSFPKYQPPPRTLAEGAVAAKVGAKILLKWLGDGGNPVHNAEAERRAVICAVCPRNDRGDWTRFFTVPAAEMIRKQIEAAKSINLTTTKDAELNVCDACGCPLKLKVHVPLPYILKHTSPEEMGKFHEDCWIIKNA